MIFDVHNNFIYHHIFKTGGTTVAAIIRKIGVHPFDVLNNNADASRNTLTFDWNAHSSFGEFLKLYPKFDLKRYFIFSFVRNPWDRAVSMYKHQQQEAVFYNFDKSERIAQARAWTFDRYLKKDWRYMPSQYEQITLNDNLVVNFVGKFERLREDLRSVFNLLKIDVSDDLFDLKLHESKDHNYARPEMYDRIHWHYSWWYKDSQVLFVETHAKKDVEFFGYFFEDKRSTMPLPVKQEYEKENVDYVE